MLQSIQIFTRIDMTMVGNMAGPLHRLKLALNSTGIFGSDAVEYLERTPFDDQTIIESVQRGMQALHPHSPRVKDNYVLGFAFNPEKTHVLLAWKSKPAWQAGKLNGIGGAVKEDELPHHAMAREFAEITNYEGLVWFSVGSRSRPATYDEQDWSYNMDIFVTTMDLQDMRDAADLKVLQCLPLNLEVIRRLGVPDLAIMVGAAMHSHETGVQLRLVDTLPPEIDGQES
jgi:ADP-ribose pyrophosphatase YjhB (NUDIX family)